MNKKQVPRERTVIVGAGLSGLRVAEGLRRLEYDGQIVIVGSETHLPYDRPPLSKEVLKGVKSESDICLKPEAYFRENDIELRLGHAAVRLNQVQKSISLADGSSLGYDKLVLATGLTPRMLGDTHGMAGLHVLRTLEDCLVLKEEVQHAQSALIVGAGFIGCEIAATLRSQGLAVTIVEPNSEPLMPAVGELVGSLVARLHRNHGVDLRTNTGVAGLLGDNQFRGALLTDGTEIQADLVVLGIGSIPQTGWLQGATFDVSDGVLCDHFGRTEDSSIWAVGDIARRYSPDRSDTRRVEHWTSAGEQAALVAKQIAGRDVEPHLPQVDYVWSDQYDVKIQAIGQILPDAKAILLEDDGKKFLVAFARNGLLTAVVGAGMAGRVMKMRRAIVAGTPIAAILDAESPATPAAANTDERGARLCR